MRTPLTFRKILPLCLAFFCLIVTVPLRGEAAEKTRVILDSDMVEMFDDGVAMLMLLQSPQIELMSPSSPAIPGQRPAPPTRFDSLKA